LQKCHTSPPPYSSKLLHTGTLPPGIDPSPVSLVVAVGAGVEIIVLEVDGAGGLEPLTSLHPDLLPAYPYFLDQWLFFASHFSADSLQTSN
jgi:hypothetical protein